MKTLQTQALIANRSKCCKQIVTLCDMINVSLPYSRQVGTQYRTQVGEEEGEGKGEGEGEGGGGGEGDINVIDTPCNKQDYLLHIAY